MLLMKLFKKKYKLTAHDFFMANIPEWMDAIGKEKREALIDSERKSKPKDCSECIFFYRIYDDESQSIYGGCSINVMIYITDVLKRHENCSLNYPE